MSYVLKQYIREVKALFPSKGKKERMYLKKLAEQINEICEEENIIDKQALYNRYGKPIDVVYEYYSSLDTEAIVKKIRFASAIKISAVVIVALVALAAVVYSLMVYQEHLKAMREEAVSADYTLIVYEETDETEFVFYGDADDQEESHN